MSTGTNYMGDMRNSHKILVEKLNRIDHSEDLGVNDGILQ